MPIIPLPHFATNVATLLRAVTGALILVYYANSCNHNNCFYRMQRILISIDNYEVIRQITQYFVKLFIAILLHGRYSTKIFILFGFCFWQIPDSLAELLNYRENMSFLDYI